MRPCKTLLGRVRLSEVVYPQPLLAPGAMSRSFPFLSLGRPRLWGCGRSRLLRLLFRRIADRDIMRGRRHRYHRTDSVAEAIVAHRPSQQTTESDVFVGADHKKLSVLRSAHKNLARVPAQEFQHPIPMRGHCLEHPGDRVSVGVRGLLGCGFCRFDGQRNIWGGEPVRPTERMHGSQHCACAFRLFCCPLQTGLAGRRVVEPDDNLASRTSSYGPTSPTLPMMLACAGGRHCHWSPARRIFVPGT
jgi:hypothetical protein